MFLNNLTKWQPEDQSPQVYAYQCTQPGEQTGGTGAHWRLVLEQMFQILEEKISPLSDLNWEGFHGKLPWRIKELACARSFSKILFLKIQNQFISSKDREVGRARDHLGLTESFQVCCWKEEHSSVGKVGKCLSRTTRELLQCTEMQTQNQKLSSNRNWSDI